MRQVSTIAELREAVTNLVRPLGLVPTMGALHEGHLSLVRQAREDNASVIATIFVNPAQFGPAEDLARYPRPLERDLGLLTNEGVDLVFTPEVGEMYGAGFATTVHVDGPALGLESDERPRHFDGVATVVAKLLVQSGADVAYFGRKDAQQAAVIRRLVRDLDIPVRVDVLPTIREYDGLAVSSRNAYLTPDERAAAPALFLALSAMRDRFHSGVQNTRELEAACRALLAREPLITSVDYVALVDPDSFDAWPGRGSCLLVAAVRMGEARLIDNVVLD